MLLKLRGYEGSVAKAVCLRFMRKFCLGQMTREIKHLVLLKLQGNAMKTVLPRVSMGGKCGQVLPRI